MRRTLREDIENSPIPATVDKFWEAWYFFLAIAGEYHDPYAFRYNLNAFIQALRSITFMLQSEEDKPTSFEAWYRDKQDNMRSDPLLRRFVEARNLIVKQSMLSSASEARLGVFRDRKFKLGVGGEIDPFTDSRILLKKATTFCLELFLDEAHSLVGEQAGVWRKWGVEAIGPEEIMIHCTAALEYMAFLVEEASRLWGTVLDASFEVPHPDSYQVLLESDVDPQLPKKWGWDKALETMRRQAKSDAEPQAPPDGYRADARSRR